MKNLIRASLCALVLHFSACSDQKPKDIEPINTVQEQTINIFENYTLGVNPEDYGFTRTHLQNDSVNFIDQ